VQKEIRAHSLEPCSFDQTFFKSLVQIGSGAFTQSLRSRVEKVASHVLPGVALVFIKFLLKIWLGALIFSYDSFVTYLKARKMGDIYD